MSFWVITPKAQATKAGNKQMTRHPTNAVLHRGKREITKWKLGKIITNHIYDKRKLQESCEEFKFNIRKTAKIKPKNAKQANGTRVSSCKRCPGNVSSLLQDSSTLSVSYFLIYSQIFIWQLSLKWHLEFFMFPHVVFGNVSVFFFDTEYNGQNREQKSII